MSAIIFGTALKEVIEQESSGYHLSMMNEETAEKNIKTFKAVGSFFLWQDSTDQSCRFTGIGSQGEIHHAHLTKDNFNWIAKNFCGCVVPELPQAIRSILGCDKITLVKFKNEVRV